MPNDLGNIASRFKHIVIPELNTGQFNMIFRAKYLIDTKAINQVNTKPFNVSDLVKRAEEIIGGKA
jgi:2-oxoglutarate ferredoxin oxidoreductase subunit alpha